MAGSKHTGKGRLSRRRFVKAALGCAAALASNAGALAAGEPTPANPNASENARKLLKFLHGLPQRAQKRIISGHLAGGAVGPEVPDKLSGWYRFKLDEIRYLHEVSGQWVGLIGADYCAGFYDFPNPLHSQMYYDEMNPALIEYWNAGGLVAITTHQFDPRELYRDGGQCFVKQLPKGTPALDIARLYTPGCEEYDNFRVIMDRWAEGLGELQRHGVVVIWRPFNEVTNSGKWWCRQPAEKFKALFRYTFLYLTLEKKLNNLLWVYDAVDKSRGHAFNLSHYPGDEFVDIVGVTMNWDSGEPAQPHHPYPKKVFACVEFNVPAAGRPWNGSERNYDYMKKFRWVIQHMPYATFFMSWDRIAGPYGRGTPESLRQMYNHPWVLNRGEVDWQSAKL